MKHNAVLSIILTMFSVAICSGTVLNVEQCYQEQDQWCWAGCSQTILKYYGADTTQTAIAAYGTEGLNEWNYLYGSSVNPTRRGIDMILEHFASLGTVYGNYVLTQTEVKNINDDFRLFVVRWGWDSGGGHFVVGHGSDGSTMHLMDPWYGPTVNSYDWVVSGSSHTWTHTLEVETYVPMPDLVVQSITVEPAYAWRPSTITAVIRNQGDAPAEFDVLDRVCRFEVDGQIEYDTLLSSPLSIPLGETYTVEATLTVSGVGSRSVTASVDPDNEGLERIETNNSRTESISWSASTIHDTDGDGMMDADEVIAGSEPDNASSCWACSFVLTNGGFRISWPSISGRTYTVERSTSLITGFSAISPPLPGLPPVNWFESVNMPSNAFYRVRVSQ